MKYAVEQKYFDNGRVSTKIKMVPNDVKSYHHEFDRFDFYVDVFDTIEQAENFEDECSKG